MFPAQTGAAASSPSGHGEAAQQPAKRQRSTDSGEAAGLPSPANGHAAAPAAQHSGADQPDVACYICQLPDILGKFDPGRAAALGIPKGSQFGVLQRGQPVTTPQGAVVQPHQVQRHTLPLLVSTRWSIRWAVRWAAC